MADELVVRTETANEQAPVTCQRLGRMPAKSSRKALMFSDFVKFLKVPTSQTYWAKKTPIPLRSYGNTEHGCCTRAKQAVAATRMERLEQRKLISITDEEVLRVYYAMTERLYGGGDTGAYETDALDCWRNPEHTFTATDGHPYTIDAYLRLNPANQDELRVALALAGAKGIAVCLNLPLAFQSLKPPVVWDIPDGPLIGAWMPGSWGGHSLWSNGFTKAGVILDHTWELEPQVVTWEAMAAYCDEAHVVIDSLNSWKKRLQGSPVAKLNLADVRDAVNEVSSVRIA